ncbi:MAG: hypothetical protein J6V22_07015, partial [Clostridia bacterium]|nr:hypothetical protein [Clostridia bacterium]
DAVYVGELFEKSSPTPLQKLSHNKYLNEFVSMQIDSRREVKPRFCYRKPVGTTKTPPAKRVVHKETIK